MDNTSEHALIPLKQAVVLFHGSEILAVRLPDNRIAATINSLCAILEIRPEGQVRRIRRHKDLAKHLLLTLIKTAGGLQRMDVLIAEAIPFWVLGVQAEQLAPEKRPLARSLQMEAALFLYHYFYAEQPTQPKSESQLDPPIQTIHQKANTAPNSLWDRLFDVLHEMRQKDEARNEQFTQYQRVVDERFSVAEEWLRSLDRHVAGMNQGGTGPITLPLLISAIFSLLERPTGRTQKQLEQEMIETFRVPAINALPDEQWEDVLAWGLWRARQPN